VGTALHQLTGNEMWDGVASFVIAALLAYIAYVLGRDTKELLIGEAADPRVRLVAYDTLVSHPEVVAVKEMLTMQLGPENVLVAARVKFDEDSTVRQVTEVCTEIEEQMRERVPELSQVFLDPTDVDPEDSRRSSRRLQDTIDEVRELDGQETLDGMRSLRSRTGRRMQRSGTRD
jgi:divalent metal cation (Fe/Co/Zn/Cd) transporter